MPRPRAASTCARIDAVDAGDDVARQHELRVGDQRDEDRRKTEAEELHENRQQREAWNRVERAEDAEHPAREVRAPRGVDAERNGDEQRDRERRRNHFEVRRRQNGDALPDARARSSCAAFCRDRVAHVQIVAR